MANIPMMALAINTPTAGKGRGIVPVAADDYLAESPLKITLGTLTTDRKALDVSATWNNVAITQTLLKANVTDTASAAGSLLMDLQVGGVSKFSTTKAGVFRVGDQGATGSYLEITPDNGSTCVITTAKGASGGNRQLDIFCPTNNNGISFGLTTRLVNISAANGLTLANSVPIQWAAGAVASGTKDLALRRDAANTLAQRNGANDQTFRLYETWTDASNYSRAYLSATSTAVTLGSEAAGTGTRRSMVLNGNNRAAYDAAPSTTVIRDILISHGLMAAA